MAMFVILTVSYLAPGEHGAEARSNIKGVSTVAPDMTEEALFAYVWACLPDAVREAKPLVLFYRAVPNQIPGPVSAGLAVSADGAS
jgi:hypothetical protein